MFNSSCFKNEDVQPSFTGFTDWFMKINDPVELWLRQPTYILVQIVFLVGSLISVIHAFLNGRRLPYLWLAAMLHGIVVETVTYNLKDIDNFWHSQTPIMFLGRRLPLHIIALYPVLIYHASIAVSRMRLPSWAEPFAVGLCVVLLDHPYDMASVKFVHWTWHDTDPNVADRMYWVPWNSYFHAIFVASFWFHATRRWLGGSEDRQGRKCQWDTNSVCKELSAVVLTVLLSMPGGVLLFLPLHHPLHDVFLIHSEVTFMMLLSFFLLIVWSADRVVVSRAPPSPDLASRGKFLLVCYLVTHYSLFLGMVIFGEPENEVSVGVHETIGPCNETVPLVTAFG